MKTSVFLNGNIDITKRVTTDVIVDTSMPDFGQVQVATLSSLIVIDIDGMFDVLNPGSPFYNFNVLTDFTISIYFDSNLVFDGLINTIVRQPNGTATINLTTQIQESLNKRLIYASAENANPAQIFGEVCDLYQIPFDSASVYTAGAVYELDEVHVSAYLTQPKVTISAFFESLATIGIARIYLLNGQLVYEVYTDKVLSPILEISSEVQNSTNILFDRPVLTPIVKQETAGYTVDYVGGQATYRDPLLLDIDTMQSVSGGSDSEVRINSLQAATWIGERWLAYLSLAQKNVDARISNFYAQDLQLGYPVTIEDPKTFINIDCEIISIQRTTKVSSVIKGQTRS